MRVERDVVGGCLRTVGEANWRDVNKICYILV